MPQHITNNTIKYVSKTYRITKDSLIISIIGNPYLEKIATKLNKTDSLYSELLNTSSEKWENIESIGKSCSNCDTCIGAKVTLQKGNLKKEYWIRCIAGAYPPNISALTDKLFLRIKE